MEKLRTGVLVAAGPQFVCFFIFQHPNSAFLRCFLSLHGQKYGCLLGMEGGKKQKNRLRPFQWENPGI